MESLNKLRYYWGFFVFLPPFLSKGGNLYFKLQFITYNLLLLSLWVFFIFVSSIITFYHCYCLELQPRSISKNISWKCLGFHPFTTIILESIDWSLVTILIVLAFSFLQHSLEYFGHRRTDYSVGNQYQGVQTPSQVCLYWVSIVITIFQLSAVGFMKLFRPKLALQFYLVSMKLLIELFLTVISLSRAVL